MNDLVVLPVVLVLIAVATDQAGGAADWAIFLVKLLVLGPAIGFAVGGLGSWLMAWMDKKRPSVLNTSRSTAWAWCWHHIRQQLQLEATGS